MLIPLSAEHYLDSFEVPNHPNLFVLGSFARHVTIYSQQVRALNIIRSLVTTKRLVAGSSVAVVGGGAAGITAAASVLLSNSGTKVTLIEKLDEVMPLQLGSAKRFVHPHIYDWPEEGSTDENAGLPIFNWSAGEARTVAADLGVQWKELQNKDSRRLSFENRARLAGLRTGTGGYEIEWNDADRRRTWRADIVLLAMGFGRDTDPLHDDEDYWQDTWIDQPRGPTSRWLVSGSGDGGLTDLMRLKVTGFQHHLIIKAFSKGRNRSLSQVRRVLKTAKPEDYVDAISREFGPALQRLLDIRSDTVVMLNDEKALSSARASLLNRIIVHELYQARAFKFQPGRLETPIKIGNEYHVPNLEGKVFDRVLIRRGPASDVPLDQIGELEIDETLKDAYKILRQRWKDWTSAHQPHEDRTRIPCWIPSELNAEGGFKAPSTKLSLPRPAGACLVVAGDLTPLDTASESDFERTIRQAIGDTEGSITSNGVALSGQPHIIRASDAFTVRSEHESVVRLLCETLVAVFDVTDLEPAVMILLGMRAVVRRGVTVTVTRNPSGPDFWATLPFNLREISTISLVHPPKSNATDRLSPINRLSGAIKDAVTEFQRQQHYSDVPAYFELRMPSEGVVDEDQVFILCPFKIDYLRKSYQGFLFPELNLIFKPKAVQLISDLTSPKLVALRLYDAIRRAFFCLADWTAWRPNVMFEFGVRCAASDQITVSLIDRISPIPKHLVGLEPQLLRLRQFFSPVEYDPAGGPGQLDGVKSLLDVYEGRAASDNPPLFILPNGHETFYKAAQAIRTEIDPELRPVEDMLCAAAKGLAEHADLQPGILFGSDPRIGQLARDAATERLLASWYFVKHRRLSLQPANDKALELLNDLGNDLLARLADDDPTRAEIQNELRKSRGGS